MVQTLDAARAPPACAAEEDTTLDGFPRADLAAKTTAGVGSTIFAVESSMDSSVGPVSSDRETEALAAAAPVAPFRATTAATSLARPVVKAKKKRIAPGGAGAASPPASTQNAFVFTPERGGMAMAAVTTPSPGFAAPGATYSPFGNKSPFGNAFTPPGQAGEVQTPAAAAPWMPTADTETSPQRATPGNSRGGKTKRASEDDAAASATASLTADAASRAAPAVKSKKKMRVMQECVTGVRISEGTGEMLPITRTAPYRPPMNAPMVKSKNGDEERRGGVKQLTPASNLGSKVQMNKGLEFSSELLSALGGLSLR